MSDCLCAISGPGLCVCVDLEMVATEKTSKPWEPSPYYFTSHDDGRVPGGVGCMGAR